MKHCYQLFTHEAEKCPAIHEKSPGKGQFPHLCFPVVDDLITTPEDPDHPVKEGIGYFAYAVPQEEFQETVRTFADQVESILNETVKQTDSDFEKAYALYQYFAEQYSYDYEAYNMMQTDIQNLRKLTACHVFNEASGICCELSVAYSYLLMQAGVDATVMMGGDHEWSYVRINGENYHIDPTYALNGSSLAYFMMNDAQRENTGFDRNEFVITSCYTQLYDTPEYTSDDDTFSPLWDTDYEAIDRECKTLSVRRYDWETEESTPFRFSYQGF
jgi:hypothetical protein